MIGTITFYRMRGSLSSGEYPLFSSGQDLSVYQVASFPRVKYRGGMQASADLPYFQGLESANVAQIGGAFYWVTEYRQRTAESNQYTITFDYMGPTSLYRSGDTVTGVWHRLPAVTNAALQDQVTNGPLTISRTLDFSALDCPQSLPYLQTYWIQITGHDNSGNIKQFGGFIGYDTDDEAFDWLNAIKAGTNGREYVSFGDWMSSMTTYTGLTAEDVDDVSISKRCPFKCRRTLIGAGVYYVELLQSDNTAVTQKTVNSKALYDLSAIRTSGAVPAPNETTVTMTLSASERLVGKASILDWNRNNIMSIEVSKFTGSVTIEAAMHSDLHGVYCNVRVGDEYMSIPEGKLPYYGNTAATYQAYAMDTDRLAMQYAIQNAHYNRETSDNSVMGNTVAGIANNVMVGALNANPVSIASGIMGGVTSGIVSAYESQRSMELTIRQAEQDNKLSAKRAIDQPSSGYNVGYGGMYAYLNENNKLCVALSMPKVASGYIDGWTGQFGYPAEGMIATTAMLGYYQGKLVSSSGGMMYDRCNETFMNGFKFVDPSGAGPVPPTPGGSYTLTLRFDTSEATVPITAQLMKSGVSVYSASITDSGVWTVGDLENGTYQIVTSADVTITPSLFTVNGSDVAYNVIVEDNTSPLTVVKLGHYDGYGDLADIGNLEWYAYLYDENNQTILGEDDTVTYRLSNGVTYTFSGKGYDLSQLCCAYEPVSSLNPRTGLIGAMYYPTAGGGYYAFYGGRCYYQASSSDSYVYVADIVEIICDKPQMLEIGTNTNMSMYLYSGRPT